MKRISLRQAEADELPWINRQYGDVGFLPSAFDKELIVIASVDQDKAGIGRLVRIDQAHLELGGIYVLPGFRGMGVAEQIVGYLCANTPFRKATTWCLPFEDLSGFYLKFGFKKHRGGPVPKEISDKLTWCNTGGKYDKKVVLLYKEGE